MGLRVESAGRNSLQFLRARQPARKGVVVGVWFARHFALASVLWEAASQLGKVGQHEVAALRNNRAYLGSLEDSGHSVALSRQVGAQLLPVAKLLAWRPKQRHLVLFSGGGKRREATGQNGGYSTVVAKGNCAACADVLT